MFPSHAAQLTFLSSDFAENCMSIILSFWLTSSALIYTQYDGSSTTAEGVWYTHCDGPFLFALVLEWFSVRCRTHYLMGPLP